MADRTFADVMAIAALMAISCFRERHRYALLRYALLRWMLRVPGHAKCPKHADQARAGRQYRQTLCLKSELYLRLSKLHVYSDAIWIDTQTNMG